MRKIIVVFCMAAIMLSLYSCQKSETFEWPESGINSVLPKPNKNKGSIGFNLEDCFSAYISATKAEYDNYKTECKNIGFTIDGTETSDSYEAYNADGYNLKLNYYEYNEKFSIYLYSPIDKNTLIWPTMGLSTLIPVPKSNIGEIHIDTSSQFEVSILNTTVEDYNSYVNECINNGFDVEYSKSEKVFSAQNTNGDSLRISYKGFNTMSISLYASDKSTNETSTVSTETTTVKTTAKKTNSSSGGIRPDFKEAMDSYEEFFDEYIAFMEKYTNSSNTASMLVDYVKYMDQYSDTMEKMNAVDEGELSDEELLYYIEVTNRINQKLLNLSL